MPSDAPAADRRRATADRRAVCACAAGAAVTAVCCFTPVLVILLTALGVGGAVAYLDLVLFPMLAGFLVLTALAWLRMRRNRAHSIPGATP